MTLLTIPHLSTYNPIPRRPLLSRWHTCTRPAIRSKLSAEEPLTLNLMCLLTTLRPSSSNQERTAGTDIRTF